MTAATPGLCAPGDLAPPPSRAEGWEGGGRQFPRLAGTAGSSLSTPWGWATRPSFLLRAAAQGPPAGTQVAGSEGQLNLS